MSKSRVMLMVTIAEKCSNDVLRNRIRSYSKHLDRYPDDLNVRTAKLAAWAVLCYRTI